jgi:phenylpropionate dioxygenase-like ring-hydroxylating dioxygenase large terminal subunit
MKSLTYKSAQQSFEKPKAPLRKFANADVVCEGWYAVGRSADFARGTIRSVSVGKESLVLYRDLSGAMRAVERACPHLGADLGRGRVVEKGLQCIFHRWCWGADGNCIAGGGVRDGRSIRTYLVKERWGIAWVWIGQSPRYELPVPMPANSRHILRLRQRRIDCHPHVILGNGLDFTHVVHVHGFQLLDDPAVEIQAPHRLSVGIHTRLKSSLMRRLLFLGGRSARWRFTTFGPSLAWLSVQEPTPFELVWAGRPLPDGSSAMQTVFFLPNRFSFVRALPMMIATTWNDKNVLEGLTFRQGFVASDAVFYLYAQLIENLPEWNPNNHSQPIVPAQNGAREKAVIESPTDAALAQAQVRQLGEGQATAASIV